MKKVFLPLLLLCSSLHGTAQLTAADVTKAKDMVFFGLDFTFLKLIHEEGFVDKNGKPMCKTLPFKYFNEWNEMFLIERDKFNLTRYFGVPNYTVDQTKATERNKAYVTEGCIIASDSYKVLPTELTEAVQEYGSGSQFGIGCVIFVESFNKTDGKSVVYTVFFDLSDHAILKIDEQEGSPFGDGFRNYWVNAIDKALNKGSKAYKR